MILERYSTEWPWSCLDDRVLGRKSWGLSAWRNIFWTQLHIWHATEEQPHRDSLSEKKPQSSTLIKGVKVLVTGLLLTRWGKGTSKMYELRARITRVIARDITAPGMRDRRCTISRISVRFLYGNETHIFRDERVIFRSETSYWLHQRQPELKKLWAMIILRNDVHGK